MGDMGHITGFAYSIFCPPALCWHTSDAMTWVLYCHTIPSYQVVEGVYWQGYSDKGRFMQPQNMSTVVLLVFVMCFPPFISALGAGVDTVCGLSLYRRLVSDDFSSEHDFFPLVVVSSPP